MGAPCHSGFHAGGRCSGGCSCSRGGSFVSSWICVGVSEVEGVGVNGSEAWRGGEGAVGGEVSVELHHQSQQVPAPTPVPMIGHFQPIPVLGGLGGLLPPGGLGGLPVPPVSDCSSVSIFVGTKPRSVAMPGTSKYVTVGAAPRKSESAGTKLRSVAPRLPAIGGIVVMLGALPATFVGTKPRSVISCAVLAGGTVVEGPYHQSRTVEYPVYIPPSTRVPAFSIELVHSLARSCRASGESVSGILSTTPGQ